MKVIQVQLPQKFNEIEIHTFADEHIGDAQSDVKRIKERIAYVKEHPNAVCILNGDIIDYASRSSIGDIETRSLNIMDQLEKATELFQEISDRIICITSGNHEFRSYKKEGIDFAKIFANAIGCSDYYSPASAVLFIKFGKGKSPSRENNSTLVSIFVNHGSGGGRKEGAKAIRLADMASIVDTDIYIHSHTHLPMIMKQGYYRTNFNAQTITFVDKLFVNTAANLSYGGYGEAQEFKPASMDTPVIYVQAKPSKKFWAKL